MRRIHLGLLTAVLPVLALCLFLLGCGPEYGKGGGGAAPIASDGGKTGDSGGATKAKPVPGKSYDAIVKGEIVFKGTPEEGALRKLTDQYRAAMSQSVDKNHCLNESPREETLQQVYQIKNDKVGNVFVWLEAAEPNAYLQVKLSEDQAKAYKEPVWLKQPHCTFVPRCFVLFPRYRGPDGKLVETGQKLEVENNAPISHNTKYKGRSNQDDTGTIGSGKKSKKPFLLTPERGPVVFRCDIHNWMRAYAWVFDHPYAAVSKAAGDDFGTFTIANAPTGVPLKVRAWHEELDYLKTSDTAIILKPGENTINIDFVKK
jgi:hypothetical protein